MTRASVVSLATVAVLALAGCTSSSSDASVDAVTVSLSDVVNATSEASGISFTVDVSSDSTVIVSSTGVLDVAELAGFRSDSAGLDGSGLEPIADVWFDSGEQYQSIDGMATEPINGGLAGFLSIVDPQDRASLDEVIANWLGSGEPQRSSRKMLDGVATTHFVLERDAPTPLEVWVDEVDRIVRVVDVGEQFQPLTTTHDFAYPDTVTIAPRP